ncbi:MAG: beta-ketoacyl synthase N-terminal-like domain-containing protein [Spongiibacteraceae bacterium]
MTIYIVTTGSYCENITDELPPLKTLVTESVNCSVRRVGRFIQLALIGAGRASQQLSKNAAVYFTSGSGDMAVTVDVLNAIYRQGEAPRPLSFINTVSNASCFYIAQSLQLNGASNFVSSRYFPMESALRLALLALKSGEQQAALVGAVDVAVTPLADHRKRMGVDENATIAEGSHWLQLVSDATNRDVLATLDDVQPFKDRAALSAYLSELPFNDTDYLALGQFVAPNEVSQWLAETDLPQFKFRDGVGEFKSQAGLAFCQFVEQGVGRLIYLNRDVVGRYMLVVVSCGAGD